MPAPASSPASRMSNNLRQPAQERLKRLQTDLNHNRKPRNRISSATSSSSDIGNEVSRSSSISSNSNSNAHHTYRSPASSILDDNRCVEKKHNSNCSSTSSAQTSPVSTTPSALQRLITAAVNIFKTPKEQRPIITPVKRRTRTTPSPTSSKECDQAAEYKSPNRPSTQRGAAATATYIDGPSTSSASLAQRLLKCAHKRVHERETTTTEAAHPKLHRLDSCEISPRFPFQQNQQCDAQEKQQTRPQTPLAATYSIKKNFVRTSSAINQQQQHKVGVEKRKSLLKPTAGPHCHGITSEPATTTRAPSNTTSEQRILSPLTHKKTPGKVVRSITWQKPGALSAAANSSQPTCTKFKINIASKRLKELKRILIENQGKNRQFTDNEAIQQMKSNVYPSVDAPKSTSAVIQNSRTAAAATASRAASNKALEAKTPTSVNRRKVVATQACLSFMHILTEIDFEPMDWTPENFEQRDHPSSDDYFAMSPIFHTHDALDFGDDADDAPITPPSSNGDEDDNAICDFSSGGTNADINELTELNEQQPFDGASCDEPVRLAAGHGNPNGAAVELNRSINNSELPAWKKDHLYFVLDTNVLINYLVFVEELTKISLGDTAGGMLFLPYTVIRELDSLKSQNQRDGLRLNAVRAINYLNAKFDDSYTIQAQSASAEQEHLVEVISADDSIINCCLQLKSVVPNMLLLTDDGNMRLKAKANDIPVTTKSDLVADYPQQFASFCDN